MADIPVRIESKFKNARLYNAIADASVRLTSDARTETLRARGPVHSFCKFHGLDYGRVCLLLSLRQGPIGTVLISDENGGERRHRTRGLRPMCARLAALLECDPAWLFPAELYAIEWPAQLVREVPLTAMERLAAVRTLALPAPQVDQVADVERCAAVQRLIGSVSPREGKAIAMRYGLDGGDEQTYEAIGEELGVSTARARQIVDKAMRLMRHPSRSRNLRSYLE